LKLFIDTWGWLTLRDRNESRHEDVKGIYHQFRGKKGIIYTSGDEHFEQVGLGFQKKP